MFNNYYIVEGTKHGSLTIAARNLHVTQSTISQPIASLDIPPLFSFSF
ncbi:LysR family transcriptional regulator [Bacillus sp. 3103sda1]|nr:LysR family transcriptional regulator [Bacillus sp. 3103sda1]MCP1123871.1 LysR family transcriptional regulator [Bacillus sp. 3103sda1]